MGTFALIGEVTEGTSSVVSTETFQPIITALQSQFSVSTLVSIIAIAIGACAGLAFAYFGIRKLSSMIMNAFTKGKVRA